MIIALAILAFFACMGVYMWTDLTEHMAEQMRLDNLWEDEVTERAEAELVGLVVGSAASNPELGPPARSLTSHIGADDPSRGLETREGLTANVGADIYPWPRVTVHARTGEPKDAA